MKNKDLQKELAQKLGVPEKEAEVLLKSLVSCIENCLVEGDSVNFNGLGTLEIKEKSERTMTNPKTKEKVEIPARKDVSFKISQTFKNQINNSEL